MSCTYEQIENMLLIRALTNTDLEWSCLNPCGLCEQLPQVPNTVTTFVDKEIDYIRLLCLGFA